MSTKKVVALVVLGVVVLSAIAMAALPSTGRGGFSGGDTVALVRLTGPIAETGSGSILGSSGITPQLVDDLLDRAADDPAAKAIVVRIDSPGGTVAASQEISSAIRDFDKPVVISMADTVASGGYYISAAADRIVAHPGTLTGSIGVIWADIDPTELLKKLGIKLDAITAGKHKDMFLPGHLNKQRRKIVQDLVDDMYDQFVTAVADGRDLDEATVRKLATGQLYTGVTGKDVGLVDELGGVDKAVEEAEELAGISNAEVVEYSPSVFSLFGGGLTGIKSLLGAPEIDPKIALLRDLLTGANVPRYVAP